MALATIRFCVESASATSLGSVRYSSPIPGTSETSASCRIRRLPSGLMSASISDGSMAKFPITRPRRNSTGSFSDSSDEMYSITAIGRRSEAVSSIESSFALSRMIPYVSNKADSRAGFTNAEPVRVNSKSSVLRTNETGQSNSGRFKSNPACSKLAIPPTR